VEIYTRNLAQAFLSRGHEVCVVCGHSRDDLPVCENIEGINVRRFSFYDALTSRNIDRVIALQREINALKREFQPDIVHVNFSDASPFFCLRTAKAEDRLVTVFHSPLDETPGGIQLATRLVSRSEAVVAPSGFMRAHLKEYLQMDSRRLRVIQNSAREDLFLQVPLLQVPPAGATVTPSLLFAARLVPAKGGSVLLSALKLLSGRGRRVSLVVAGAGPEKQNLVDQAQALGISENVFFAGGLSQAQLADAMHRANAVVIPSLFPDPAPLVSIEAALAGRAVIASRTGGLVDIVEDKHTGLLFEKGNPAALADAIEMLLSDPELQSRLGGQARAAAVKKYTLTAMADNYEELYAEILTSEPS
jgi:glycogen(starch) synthase